jgi:hypothetical protein
MAAMGNVLNRTIGFLLYAMAIHSFSGQSHGQSEYPGHFYSHEQNLVDFFSVFHSRNWGIAKYITQTLEPFSPGRSYNNSSPCPGHPLMLTEEKSLPFTLPPPYLPCSSIIIFKMTRRY